MQQADQNAAAMMSSAAQGHMYPQQYQQSGAADPSAQFASHPSLPTQYPNQSMCHRLIYIVLVRITLNLCIDSL